MRMIWGFIVAIMAVGGAADSAFAQVTESYFTPELKPRSQPIQDGHIETYTHPDGMKEIVTRYWDGRVGLPDGRVLTAKEYDEFRRGQAAGSDARRSSNRALPTKASAEDFAPVAPVNQPDSDSKSNPLSFVVIVALVAAFLAAIFRSRPQPVVTDGGEVG
jgi:hypothetical protein